MEKLLKALAFDDINFLTTTQWMILVGIIVAAFFIEKVFNLIANFAIKKNLPIIRNAPNDKLEKTIRPIGKLISIWGTFLGIQFLDLTQSQEDTFFRILFILTSLVAIWLGHRIVDIISYYFTQIAQRTDTKFDDILIPLISKTAYVLVYLFGLVFIAHTLTIDVTGLVAGLGIGGLAFAFAAKDTIANLFGSVMLVLDRPFDIGDVIKAGDIEGTVDQVGFRSTQIRTFYDSIITVPNGVLMNQSIDNKGKRRYRRLTTTLGLEYDTPPEKIEAFCEGVRQLIVNHKWTRKDNFHVYFVNFGASSLDIQVVVYWETNDYARELAEKHRLMVDILRLANDMEVSFAFPTQTVHMFNESTVTQKEMDKEKYLQEGIAKASEVTNRPLSLKNPRSNAQDKNQFGDNDIGL